MLLERIDITNFRGIRHLRLKLDETTVLIGENNTAKSTILQALQTCLSRSLTHRGRIFSEYDYHLPEKDSQPADSEAIDITLRFAEQSENEWPDEVVQILSDSIQIDENDLQIVILRVRSKYDNAIDDFATTWDFLDLAGNELTNAKSPRNIISLQQLTPVFYLEALRDSAQEFRPRSQFWGPFVRSLKIDPDLRQSLENELEALNLKVLDAHESFGEIKEQLSNTRKMVPLGSDDPVNIEAVPGKVFDILSRTQVMLTSTTGARLPIGRHGEGTQSLAVICLFDAFLQSKLQESYSEQASPILALEEPEAHLHPSAIRSVAKLLHELRGQKIIATHSGDLVSGVPLLSLRRLRRKDGAITVHQIEEGTLTADEMRKLNYHVRSTRGNRLFARCWLLVEGETEYTLFEECARICGYDLVAEGIVPIEFAQVGIKEFIKLAEQLGIEWLVVADGDDEGAKYIKSAESQIDSPADNDRIHQLAHGNMEEFLCMEGYGSVYEANVSEQKRKDIPADAKQEPLKYWKEVIKVTNAQRKNSKPRNAIKVIEQMEKEGKQGVPAQLREIIECAIGFARGAG